MDSQASGDSGTDEVPRRTTSISEDEDDRDTFDEDMYTTKAYRVEHNYEWSKSKGKSPIKSGKTSLQAPYFAPRTSSGDSAREEEAQSTATREVSDLSVYLRSKNSKSMKNRHVTRKSQRSKKQMESSFWHSEENENVPVDIDDLTIKSPPDKSKSKNTELRTPSKSNTVDGSGSRAHLFHSPQESLSTPVRSNMTGKSSATSLSRAAVNKKRMHNNNSSGIGNLMKSIGVKGAHHHGSASSSSRKVTASPRPPTTPRLVRTPSSQTQSSASSIQQRSLSPRPLQKSPSTLDKDNASSFSSPRPISSSPFIQKFDSNILRTPTIATPVPSTPRKTVTSPTLSPSVSQNLMPQLDDDHTNLGTGVTHAIFQALFGQQGGDLASSISESSHVSEDQVIPVHIPRWDDSDEEEEEEDEHCLGPDLAHCKDIDVVDEKWLTDLIKSRSNSRSSSLDLTHRDRTSPLQSDQAGKGVRILTPAISSAAFEQALKKNLGSSSEVETVEEDAPLAVLPPHQDETNSNVTTGVNPGHIMTHSQVVPAASNHNVVGLSPKAVVTTDSMLQRYITPTLITQMVLQLPHDDERLTSPRLSVLKALFKNCPSLRNIIAHALVVAAHSRFLRCEESRQLARNKGSELNEASLTTDCMHITGFEGKPKESPFSTMQKGSQVSREENPGTLVRDHDSSLIELTLFILITECSLPPDVPSASPSAASTHKTGADCDTVSNPITFSALAQGSFEVIVSIVTNVMRCYGSRLGKSAGSVEQPGIIKGVMKIVDILMTNKVDNVRGKAAVTSLLRRLNQRWPKGNHPQEVAYIKLSGHILVHLRPSMSNASLNATPPPQINEDNICLSHVLRLSARSIDTNGSPVQKTLRKLVECMSSFHFKVANQAIQTVMQLNILHPHFISNPYPWSRTPLKFGDKPCQVDEEPTAVEALVEVLRNNRSHWHPQVRNLSEDSLDNLLDYL